MIYIDSFQFPGVENEEKFVNYIQRTCYTSFYPSGVFAENQLRELSFSEITIWYGNNDLDERPVDIKKWTELEGVRTYFEFFEKHREEF